MAKRLTLYILIGLVLGIIVGWGINARFDQGTPESAALLKTISKWISARRTAMTFSIS